MDLDLIQTLGERVNAEWDNGTFLGPDEDRSAAWVRSAMLIAERARIMSDHKSHSLGILADVVLKVKVLIDEMDLHPDAFALDSLYDLRKLVDW